MNNTERRDTIVTIIAMRLFRPLIVETFADVGGLKFIRASGSIFSYIAYGRQFLSFISVVPFVSQNRIGFS